MIFDLAKDFSHALAAMPQDHPRRRLLALLEEALRRDIHFIARHPTTLFQCLWNTCWWYDCPEAAKHYEEPEGGWSPSGPPWQRPGPRLSVFLGAWRQSQELTRPGFLWLRSIRPPVIHLGTAMRAVIRGHQQGVTALASSADGRRMASGSSDGAVQIWDMPTMLPLGGLLRQSGGVYALAFSPDGASIAAGGGDGTLVIREADSGTVLLDLRGHKSGVNGVSFAPNGRTLASGGADGVLCLWDAASGVECGRASMHDDGISAVAFSPKGNLIVSGSALGGLRFWEMGDDRRLNLVGEFPISATSLAFSPEGDQLACGTADHHVRVLAVPTGRILACLKAHRRFVTCVGWSSDGRYVVSGSDDATACVWRMPTGEAVACLRGHEDEVKGVVILPGDNQIVTGGADMTIRVWSIEGTSRVARLLSDQAAYSCHGFLPGGHRLLTLAGDGTVREWDAHEGLCLKTGRVEYRNEFELALLAGRIVQQLKASATVTQRPWKMFEANRETIVRSCETGEAAAYFPQVFDRRVSHPTDAVWACTVVNWAGVVPSHLYLLALEGEADGAKSKEARFILVCFQKPGPPSIVDALPDLLEHLAATEGLVFPEERVINPGKGAKARLEIHAWTVDGAQIAGPHISLAFGHLATERGVDLTHLAVDGREIETDNPYYPNIRVMWAATP